MNIPSDGTVMMIMYRKIHEGRRRWKVVGIHGKKEADEKAEMRIGIMISIIPFGYRVIWC